MTNEEKIKFKQLLKSTCIDILQKRVGAAEFTMLQAQEWANSEDKSSAGDKYETSRAMGQIDRDLHARQAAEARRELQTAKQINAEQINTTFIKGSIAVCKGEYYFSSVGLGRVKVGDHKIIFLSPDAPLSRAMFLKKESDTIFFNQMKMILEEVY